MGQATRYPEELEEVWVLRALEVPLARDWDMLQDMPARLVIDMLLLRAGVADAEEWREMEAKMAGPAPNAAQMRLPFGAPMPGLPA